MMMMILKQKYTEVNDNKRKQPQQCNEANGKSWHKFLVKKYVLSLHLISVLIEVPFTRAQE